MATGINRAEAEQLYALADQKINTVRDQAEQVKATIAQVTTEGLQGNAAEASVALSNEIQITADNTVNIIQRYQQALMEHVDNITASDNQFASQIGGM